MHASHFLLCGNNKNLWFALFMVWYDMSGSCQYLSGGDRYHLLFTGPGNSEWSKCLDKNVNFGYFPNANGLVLTGYLFYLLCILLSRPE